jgi:hypothetical protein
MAALLVAACALLSLAVAQNIEVSVLPKSSPSSPGNGVVFALRKCCGAGEYIPAADLVLVRGVTYSFHTATLQDPVAGLHPFMLSLSPVGGDYNPYTQGVSVSPPWMLPGVAMSNAVLTFTPTEATPDTMYYQCLVHQDMGGNISVVNAERPTEDHGNTPTTEASSTTADEPTTTAADEPTTTATATLDGDVTLVPTLPVVSTSSSPSTATIEPDTTGSGSGEEPTTLPPTGRPTSPPTSTPNDPTCVYTRVDYFTLTFPFMQVEGTAAQCQELCCREKVCAGFARSQYASDADNSTCFLKAKISSEEDFIVRDQDMYTFISEFSVCWCVCLCMRVCVRVCVCV